MQTITCYDVQVWDGGERTNHKFYVSSKEEADTWKLNNKYDSVYEQKFDIYDTIEEYKESNSKATRDRALAKLTPIERKALGF